MNMNEFDNNQDLNNQSENTDKIEVFFDTETTSNSPKTGGIIDLGMIKRINGVIVARKQMYFKYNPEDKWEEGAFKVHKITKEFLEDKEPFAYYAEEIIDFIRGADMIAHNATFDISMLSKELERAKFENVFSYIKKVHDTIRMSKLVRPGKKHKLDQVCNYYGIDTKGRDDRHTALEDTEILIEVHDRLAIDIAGRTVDYESDIPRKPIQRITSLSNIQLPTISLSQDDLLAHNAILDDIQKEDKVTPIARISEITNEEKNQKKEEDKPRKFSMI